MFSLFARRVVSRTATPAMLLNATSRFTSLTLAATSRPAWSRSLLTTTQVLEPAAATAKKVKTDKNASAIKKKPVAQKNKAVKKKADGKKKKKKAEPPKPKRVPKEQRPPTRPPSPFFLYLRDFRSALPETRSPTELVEQSRQGGVSWNELSPSQKQPYRDIFQEKMKEFRSEMAEYLETTPRSILLQLNKKRKFSAPILRGPHKKSGSSSSFALFFQEWYRREGKVVGDDMKDKMRRASLLWKGMSDAEKQPYVTRALSLRERAKSAESQ